MVDWTRPLTRVLILKTGKQLRTLNDAASLISKHFGSVTHSAPLEHAVTLLLWAAETGTRADRKSGDGSGHARAMAERDDVAMAWRPPTLPSDLREGAAPARQRHGRTAVMRSDAPVHHSQ
jgi:hypothetical protein